LVFSEADISNIVDTILNGPVASGKFQESFRGSLLTTEGGHCVEGLVGFLARGEMLTEALDAKDLGHIGELEVVVELGAGANLSNLDATVGLFNGGGLRGENPR
jgi:hypothetical protein